MFSAQGRQTGDPRAQAPTAFGEARKPSRQHEAALKGSIWDSPQDTEHTEKTKGVTAARAGCPQASRSWTAPAIAAGLRRASFHMDSDMDGQDAQDHT